MAFSTMLADAESYVGGSFVFARTPRRSFNSLATASRTARIAGSLSDRFAQGVDCLRDCSLTLHTLALNTHAPDHHARLDLHH